MAHRIVSHRILLFLLRDAMLAWYMLQPCVCLSVHLLRASTTSKQLSVLSRKQRRTLDQG